MLRFKNNPPRCKCGVEATMFVWWTGGGPAATMCGGCEVKAREDQMFFISRPIPEPPKGPPPNEAKVPPGFTSPADVADELLKQFLDGATPDVRRDPAYMAVAKFAFASGVMMVMKSFLESAKLQNHDAEGTKYLDEMHHGAYLTLDRVVKENAKLMAEQN